MYNKGSSYTLKGKNDCPSNIFIAHSPRHKGGQNHATLVSNSHRNLYFVNSVNAPACLSPGPRAASPSSAPISTPYSELMILASLYDLAACCLT